MAANVTINRLSGAVVDEGTVSQFSLTVSGAVGGEVVRLYGSGDVSGAFVTSLASAFGSPAGITITANSFDSVNITLAAGTYDLPFNRTVGTQIGGNGDKATWAAGDQRQYDYFLAAVSGSPTTGGSVPQWITYTVPPSGLPALSGVYPAKVNPDFSFAHGVNIAGAEFGSAIWPTTGRTSYAQSEGYRLVRVPFLTNRVLNVGTSPWTAGAGLETLASVVADITSKGMIALVDMHEYGRVNGALIGVDSNASENFAIAWRIIANRLKGISNNICFGLSNEPNVQSATAWLSGANLAIAHIRDVGAGHPIFVMGSYWGGAHAWYGNDNNVVMQGVTDPISNVVIEAHQYFDTDSSGTHYDDASLTTANMADKMAGFTSWCRQYGFRGFIGEFGVQATTAGVAKMGQMLDHIVANKDVYAGWAYWAMGPWGSYPYSVDSDVGPSVAQEVKLRTYTGQTVSGGVMGTGGPSSGPPPPPPTLTVSLAATEPADAPVFLAIGPGEVALDFTAAIPPQVTFTSGPAGYAKKSDGTLQAFTAGTPRRTDLGLVVEPSQADLYDATSASAIGGTYAASTATTSPAGGTAGLYRYTVNTSNQEHSLFNSVTATAGQPLEFSAYVKAVGQSYVWMRSNSSGSYTNVAFSLTGSGIVTWTGAGWSGAGIEALAGGWYRIWANITPTGTAPQFLIGLYSSPVAFDGSPAYTGNGTDGFYIWNAQVVAASKPSTPIDGVATRAADVVSFVVPLNVTQLTYVFDDNSSQVVTGVSAGSYSIPTSGLNRYQIKSISSSGFNANMAVTEPADTPAFAMTAVTGVSFAITEPADTPAIVIGDNNYQLAATEPADTPAFAVSVTGATVVTWDASHKASDITLSNGNLTFTKTADSDHGLISTFGITNQLIYAELELVGASNSGYAFGVVNGSYDVNTYPGQAATGFAANDGGDIRHSAANVGASGRVGGVPSNGRMAIAINGTTRQGWWKNLGSTVADWNGVVGATPSGDPVSDPALPATVKIYAEGDSNTAGLGSGGTSNAYPALAQPLLTSGPTYTVQNGGASGISLPTILSNFSSRGGAAFDATKTVNIFSIMAGTNTSGSSDTTAAQKYLILRDILRAARKAGFQRTVVMTYVPRGDNVGFWTGTLVPFNQAIRDMYWSDLYADAMVDPCSDPHLTDNTSTADTTYYNTDLLHLTALSEQLVANKYAPGVNGILAAAGATVRGPLALHPYDNKNVTLSNGNRTIVVPSGFGTCYARAVNGEKAGKWAWEDKIDTLSNNITLGVTNALFNSFFGEPGTTTDSFGYQHTGAIRTNGATVATADTLTTGDIVQHRLDMDAKLWWVRRVRSGVPGNWNGNASADPVAGVGGIDISGIFRTIAAAGDDRVFPIVRLNAGTDQVTVSYAAAQLSAAPETGFHAWDYVPSAPSSGGSTTTYDFTTSIPSAVTVTSAPSGLAKKADLTLQSFSANAGRRTDLGLLVESAATNLLSYSSDTSQSAWSVFNGSFTQNNATAPDGTATADTFLETTANAQHVWHQLVSVTPSSTYTLSCYVKSVGGRNCYIQANRQDSLVASCVFFDLTTGVATLGPDLAGGGFSGKSAAIEPAGNGFWRISFTLTGEASTTGLYLLCGPSTGAGPSDTRNYAGDVTKGLVFWGAQIEAGSKATSLIQTTSATASRAADQISFTIPATVDTVTYTFDNDSTQNVSVSAGSYTIPTNLSRAQIKSIAYTIPATSPSSGIDISSLGDSTVPIFLAAQAFYSGRAGTLRVASNEWVGTPPAGFSSVNDFVASDRAILGSQTTALPSTAETAGVVVSGSSATAAAADAQTATVGLVVSATASKTTILPSQIAAMTATDGIHFSADQVTAAPAQVATSAIFSPAVQNVTTVAPAQVATAQVTVSAAHTSVTMAPAQEAFVVLAASRTMAVNQITASPLQTATARVAMTAQADQFTTLPAVLAGAATGAHAVSHGNEELWALGRTARFVRVNSFERR